MDEAVVRPHPEPWNKGKLVGQKAPFKLKEIWAIRVRLQTVSQSARSRSIRPWYRQQPARSRQAEGPRHLPRRPRRRAGPVPAYKYGLRRPFGSKRRSASFKNQGFTRLDTTCARGTLFRV